MNRSGKVFYLSGGGARGAYQVGVLKGIQSILNVKALPVSRLSSISAGSINAAMLAMHPDDFPRAVERLVDLWSHLTCEKIYEASNLSLVKSVCRNLYSMLFHLVLEGGGYLLDTTPLKYLLENELDFAVIRENIANGSLDCFDVAATCYDSALTYSFYQATTPRNDWKKTRHVSCPTEINYHHILASAALPLFFPAIEIDKLHFGDGGLRLNSPLRSAIYLGATDIFIIGTRHKRTSDNEPIPRPAGGITYAMILGNMLNALFLDNLDRDIDLVEKINSNIKLVPESQRGLSQWKHINVLYINPSVDIGKIAEEKEYPLPLFLQYLLHAFGSKKQSGDVISFLLFDSTYCKELIEIGYNDAMQQKDEIEAFFKK